MRFCLLDKKQKVESLQNKEKGKSLFKKMGNSLQILIIYLPNEIAIIVIYQKEQRAEGQFLFCYSLFFALFFHKKTATKSNSLFAPFHKQQKERFAFYKSDPKSNLRVSSLQFAPFTLCKKEQKSNSLVCSKLK